MLIEQQEYQRRRRLEVRDNISKRLEQAQLKKEQMSRRIRNNAVVAVIAAALGLNYYLTGEGVSIDITGPIMITPDIAHFDLHANATTMTAVSGILAARSVYRIVSSWMTKSQQSIDIRDYSQFLQDNHVPPIQH